MSDITFDKLTFVDRLKAGGFSEEQARTQAEALDVALRESVATKADIAALRADIRESDIKVEQKITEAKSDMIRWLVPLLLGQAALIATLVRVL